MLQRSLTTRSSSIITSSLMRHRQAVELPISRNTSIWSARYLSSNVGSEGKNDNVGGGRGNDNRESTRSGRGGGGGRGRGRGGGGWKQNKNFRGGRGNDNRNKPNFSETVLKPAARGELTKHQSGIPRLANRQGKGHAVRGADPLLESESDEILGYSEDELYMEESDSGRMRGETGSRSISRNNQHQQKKTGTIAEGSKLEDLNVKEYEEVMDFVQMYQALAYMPDTEEYYWNESDYENLSTVKKEAMFDKLKKEATHDADGNLVIEVDDETYNLMESFAEDEGNSERTSESDEKQNQPERSRGKENDQEVQFVMDAMGIKTFDKPPNPETYDVVKPLALKGPTVQDFVRSMMEHPTKFGQLKFNFPHPESKREPVPDIPPRRRNPPPEFIEASARFIHVWGIPPLSVDNLPGSLDNPVHAMEIQKVVAALFDVQPEAVFPSSISSAFVGFPSPADQRFALEVGPMVQVIDSPVTISKYVPKEGEKKSFGDDELESVVLLENLPYGHSPASLATTLFMPDTEVGLVFGDVKTEDFVMLSPHSAVLRFESAEKADNAIASSLVEQRLQEFGQHQVRYSKARRELVYTGKHTGPFGTDPERTLGLKLIVDGDMPKKNFFLSHAMTLQLRNLDPSITKQEISAFFQSCCALPRDVEGSVEFVTCYRGLPTGKAYVGFDQHGEAEAAMAMCDSSGRLLGLGQNKIIMKRVREATKISREKRPSRKEGDLLESLDNWEQYVDPKDLQDLYEHGISKDALDEALRTIRYHNPTFASMDQAMRTETVNPEKESGGMYREMVETYISTLKECISTPDDPGVIYESFFLPDEEIDTEIFDKEPLRQEALKQKREVP
ncbi:RNA recognition motif containing protein [Nitzschia inconspicua]|uniref:RNA recognition motif containing protein n=1 Tax=Nitzschia inconspicua TaxID=303405 RepID=A0A9K3KNL4_9STRA|nr:RNA recognition motif containing protein [Nitzschia inconspicua]